MSHNANGRVITGYERPVYFKKVAGAETQVSHPLARGVDASIAVESTDNLIFYADNGEAENLAGTFKSGTLTLTVDGLFDDAADAIFGRTPVDAPATGTAAWQSYNRETKIPQVAIGFIVRYICKGEELFVPFILPRCTFKPEATTAKTQGESIEFQTQSLEAKISAITESGITGCNVGDWKYTGQYYDTEATPATLKDGFPSADAAMTALQAKIVTVFGT